MTFWLDPAGSRAPYRPGLNTAKPPVQLEVPAALDIAPVLRPVIEKPSVGPTARRRRRRNVSIAIATALAVHVGLAVLLSSSASKAKLDIPYRADSGAMFASLTPASSITPEPSDQPPLPDTSIDQSEAVKPPSQTPVAADTPPLAQPDTPHPMQSAEIDQATLNTSMVKSDAPAPLNGGPQNPWAHASVAVPDPSTAERLWAAIKPCWKDDDLGTSSLRLVLDDGGRVQRMTDLEGGDALANPKVRPLARAAEACAPYDRLVNTAGSYLIVAPS